MNYAQIISLFNQYLKDDSGDSFEHFMSGKSMDYTPNESLDVSFVQTGKVDKNGKYQQLLKYLAEHKVEIVSTAAKNDLNRLYRQLMIKNAQLKLDDNILKYVYDEGVQLVGNKRGGKYKLRKTGGAKYWLFSVGVKKILIPALITGAVVAGALATAGALLPVGGGVLGLVSDSIATNILSGAVLGFPIGVGLTAATLAIKDAITKHHYKKMIKEKGVNYLIEKIENTQKEIESKKGFFHAIGNYFRRNKNRNRLWAVVKHRAEISDKYNSAENSQEKQEIQNNITKIDNFLDAHINNEYNSAIKSNRSFDDLDIIGKYYMYDLANDSPELNPKNRLNPRNIRHPGRTSSKDVQVTTKNILSALARQRLAGELEDEVSSKVIPDNEIRKPSERKQARTARREEERKREEADDKLRELRDADDAKKAEEARKARQAARAERQAAREERKNKKNEKPAETDAKKPSDTKNDDKQADPKAADKKEDRKPVDPKTADTKADDSKSADTKKDADKPADDKKDEKKKPVAVNRGSKKLPENITSYRVIKKEIVDGDSFLKKKLVARLELTCEERKEDGTVETKIVKRTIDVQKGKKSDLKDLANTPSELDTAIQQVIGRNIKATAKTETGAGTKTPAKTTDKKGESKEKNADPSLDDILNMFNNGGRTV